MGIWDIFKGNKNDWETVHTSKADIHWEDIGLHETLAYYHIQYSKLRNRYRIHIEKVNSSWRMKNKDPKDHNLYHKCLNKVNKANVKLMEEEMDENDIVQQREDSINDLLK